VLVIWDIMSEYFKYFIAYMFVILVRIVSFKLERNYYFPLNASKEFIIMDSLVILIVVPAGLYFFSQWRIGKNVNI